MRALVVDDSTSMRDVLRKILEDLDVEVFEATQGEEAMAVLQQQGGVDFALVDRHMPVMDGLDWLRQVRASQAYPGMKVVMVTSDADITKAVSSGVDRFITKPFRRETIRNALVQMGFDLADFSS
jgi:two-component system, chemotaxis family, chemotaxis protein CheY